MGIFKDENGNSYGDWTHRGQGRTRDAANDIVTTGDEKKWYDQTFWIVFFLVVLWPVGLVLMWRGACTWHVAVKILVTIVLVGVVALSYQMSQAVVAAQGTMGGIAARPGASAGSSPCLCNGSLDGTDHWTVPNAFAPARGTIPLPRLTRLFSLVKARHRGRRWRAFPILYAVAPCMRGRLRAS